MNISALVTHGLFSSKFYYCSSVWLTDILLIRVLIICLTTTSNSVLKAFFSQSQRNFSSFEGRNTDIIPDKFHGQGYGLSMDKAMVFRSKTRHFNFDKTTMQKLEDGHSKSCKKMLKKYIYIHYSSFFSFFQKSRANLRLLADFIQRKTD